jgi:signal transduction histidine kinase
MAAWWSRRSQAEVFAHAVAITLIIGIADYLTGSEITLSVVYGIPILLATWYVGAWSGVFIAVLSVAVWIVGDVTMGAVHQGEFVLVWNGAIRLVLFVLLILLLHRLNVLQRSLEQRVIERAAALARESSQRQQLERDLLDVSEREQRRIGQDLHDGLCQHLTGTALFSQVLTERLASHDAQEVGAARRITELVEEGIALARGMAKGLNPVDLGPDALMRALEEFSGSTSDLFGVNCRFECDSPVLVNDLATATNLFRIAQEATGNAIKHGKAQNIAIALEMSETETLLSIADDGCGISDPPANTGMGLRIMADRARIIGADLDIGPSPTGGVLVACLLPNAASKELKT